MLILYLAFLVALTIVGGLVGGILFQVSCVIINRIAGRRDGSVSWRQTIFEQPYFVKQKGPYAPPGTVARPEMTVAAVVPFPGFHRAFGIVSGTILVHGGLTLFLTIVLSSLVDGYALEPGVRFFHTLVYILFPVFLAFATYLGLGIDWKCAIGIAVTFTFLCAFLYGAVLVGIRITELGRRVRQS